MIATCYTMRLILIFASNKSFRVVIATKKPFKIPQKCVELKTNLKNSAEKKGKPNIYLLYTTINYINKERTSTKE